MAAYDPPLLFTPGPLTTSAATKAAMQVDLGSRDPRFLRVVQDVRAQLLALAGTASPAHECVLLQGSGTYAVESVITSSVPRTGKLLVALNGAYGRRMLDMARVAGVPIATPVEAHESRALDAGAVVAAVQADAGITHVAVVHHETTAGVLNPVEAIAAGLAALQLGTSGRSITLIVDSMSAFGAYELDLAKNPGIHFLVSSANKCIEGVPGFAFALCEAGALRACAGNARSLSLDLHAQWAGLRAPPAGSGQFRFTPPTHALLAFHAALGEHAAEGGVAGRFAKYAANHAALLSGMAALGFHPYVTAPGEQGVIITTFLFPEDAAFRFPELYEALSARGFVIYPGKLTSSADTFRIGNIGRLTPQHMGELVAAVKDVLVQQGVALPVKQKQPPTA